MPTKSALLAPVLLVVIGTGACSGAGPSPARAADTVASIATTPGSPSTAAPAGRKSEPYWVPVASFTGTGPMTTTAFTVDAGAIQWRATWHCGGGTAFTVAAVNAAGQESPRKLADAPACPADGQGYAVDTGGETLRVAASGPWRVDVEQEVDVPLVEPPPANLAGARVLGTATMHGIDKVGEGTATIYETADGAHLVRLDHFFVTINSQLELRLSAAVAPKASTDIAGAAFTTVAPLKATEGDMNYPVPADVDLSQYNSVVVWLDANRSAYSAGAITR